MISDSNQSKSNQNDEIRVLEPHSSNKFPLSNRETEVDNGAIISEPYLKTDNLFVWLVGSTIFTLPYDAIEEYLIFKVEQIVEREQQRFLSFQGQLLPLVRISELLDYNHYLSEQSSWKINEDRDSQTKIILIARSQDRLVAVESCLSNMVAKPQLAIEPFEHNLNSPPYCYGCTLWQDNLVLVIDGAALLESAIALDKKNKTKFFYLHQPSNNYLPDASTTNTYNKPTILVVDDSRTLRQIIIYTLEKGGYQIAEAANGREAIAQLHQNSEIRLVISDIDMPTMNGLEFLDYCRRDPKLAQVPVVMLSSHNSIGAIQKVSRLGAKAYFTKPYQESELLAKVKTMIG